MVSSGGRSSLLRSSASSLAEDGSMDSTGYRDGFDDAWEAENGTPLSTVVDPERDCCNGFDLDCQEAGVCGSAAALGAGYVRCGGPAPVCDLGCDDRASGTDDHDGTRGTDPKRNGVAYYLRPVWFGYLVAFCLGVALSTNVVGFLLGWGIVLATVTRWVRAHGLVVRGRHGGFALRSGAAGALLGRSPRPGTSVGP